MSVVAMMSRLLREVSHLFSPPDPDERTVNGHTPEQWNRAYYLVSYFIFKNNVSKSNKGKYNSTRPQ